MDKTTRLGRSGAFWQELRDMITVRDSKSFERISNLQRDRRREGRRAGMKAWTPPGACKS